MKHYKEVAVGGDRLLVSHGDFERRCNVLIWEEQQKLEPNNAIIDVLCNAIRLSREHCHAMTRPIQADAHAPLLAALDKAEEAIVFIQSAIPVARDGFYYPSRDICASALAAIHKVKSKKITTPIKPILRADGSEVRCNSWIHWFAADSKIGDKCMCGQAVREPRKRKAKGEK